MCDVQICNRPARYWIQTNLPADAPHTTPNAIVGEINPDRNQLTCGVHIGRAVREMHAYVTEYLAGPGKYVAYRWAGLVVKTGVEGAWR